MANLQELFDFYMNTGPTEWKLRNASNLLIHSCQALNVNSAEEIDEEQLEELPAALDRFFRNAPQKAVHDKGILAEMIGRFGPIDNLQNVLNRLLNDPDPNLRQFALQSLEYHAQINLDNILPIIEHYRQQSDPLMKQVTAIMLARLSILHLLEEKIKSLLFLWSEQGNNEFVTLIFEEVKRQAANSIDVPERKRKFIQIRDWMQEQFEFLK